MDSSKDSLPPDLFDKTTLFSLGLCVAILAAAYLGSLRLLDQKTPRSLRFLFIWHAFDALTHFCIEAPWLYHCFFSWVPLADVADPLALAPTPYNFRGHTDRAYGPQAAGDSPTALMWMVYAKADKRWAGADLALFSLEFLTVFLCGPLACAVCYGIARKKRFVNVVMILVATMELYGSFITFCPEWLVMSINLDTSNFMYKWVYLYFFNLLWIFIPTYAIWVAVGDIHDALEVRSRAQAANKSK
ncbi:Emopamil-binding protein [Xylariaceae sp. FL0662B]|nr:Emopamil-binding protein [Xylariaceae sp. FL0662B]